MCWIFERNMKKGGTSWKDVPHGLFYKASPPGGSCRPQATDEGKAYGHFPFTGNSH